MPRPKERNLLEAALLNIEVVVDAATTNDAIASIPVIGTAFKVCKAIDDIRARALAAKLHGFVSEPGLRSGSVCLNSIPRFISGLRADR